MSVGVVNKQTGDRIPTAGMPAIDSVLSGSSTNPVQNRVVKAALDEKADTDLVASDFDATASYTAGNYCIYEGKFYKFKNNHSGAWSAADVDEIKIAGELSSLMSGLTNLDNEVNGDATVYPYADVITIEDAIPSNLADCKVKIEPVQDLHGYDKPWVGGSYKNVMPCAVTDSVVIANVTCTSDGNGVYTLKGTANDNSEVTFRFDSFTIPDGATWFVCLMNSEALSGVSITFKNGNTNVDSYGLTTVNRTGHYSALSGKECNGFAISIKSGTTYNLTISPQFVANEEDTTTFYRYENICPITGHTEVSVQRDGKNLVDITNLKIFGINSINGKPISMPNEHAYVVNHVSGKTVTVSRSGASSSGYFWYGTYDTSLDSGITPLSFGNLGNDALSATINVPVGTVDLVIFTGTDVPQNLQVELGTTPTPYVPYAGKTYTIALGDTIYGGTVDFDSGVMTVDRAIVVYDGSEDEVWYDNKISNGYSIVRPSGANTPAICNQFAYRASSTAVSGEFWVGGSNLNFVCADTIVTLADWKTHLSNHPLQVCYTVDDTTIQLTPQQIQLLKGQNTLTASTGQISVTVNGVSGSIGQVQEQVNATDTALAELAADIAEQLPTAPTTDGAYVLTVTVADGTPTYSWESTT